MDPKAPSKKLVVKILGVVEENPTFAQLFPPSLSKSVLPALHSCLFLKASTFLELKDLLSLRNVSKEKAGLLDLARKTFDLVM